MNWLRTFYRIGQTRRRRLQAAPEVEREPLILQGNEARSNRVHSRQCAPHAKSPLFRGFYRNPPQKLCGFLSRQLRLNRHATILTPSQINQFQAKSSRSKPNQQPNQQGKTWADCKARNAPVMSGDVGLASSDADSVAYNQHLPRS
jgi:hypothetical protein